MAKILIVEDEAGLRQGLEINLRLENYETAQAADGEEAIRLFHSEQPDLILLDLMLPKRSGFEVLDHIRKYLCPYFRFSSLPVPRNCFDNILITDSNPHNFSRQPLNQREQCWHSQCEVTLPMC